MKVTLPYDPEWRALDWAKINCKSYITNQASSKSFKLVAVKGGWANTQERYIDYFFSDEQDAVMFTLRWS